MPGIVGVDAGDFEGDTAIKFLEALIASELRSARALEPRGRLGSG
jgi:hypothetical protein